MCGEVRDGRASGKDMEMEGYFFFNPIFIIGMLILFVIIVIVVSWYLQKLKSIKEDIEKGLKESDLSEKNAEVLEGLLSSIDEGAGRQANFGPTTEKVFSADQPANLVGDEEECEPGKIMTIIPDKDFRNFPKTEEEQMKMRRHNMLQMLSLPPLS